MSVAKYCTCGGKTEYTIKIPLFCSSCGKSFSETFSQNVNKTNTTTPVVTRTVSKSPVSYKYSANRSENEDDYDKSEIEVMAAELVKSVGSLFVANIPKSDTNVKMGDIMKNPDAFAHLGQRSSVQAELPPEQN